MLAADDENTILSVYRAVLEPTRDPNALQQKAAKIFGKKALSPPANAITTKVVLATCQQAEQAVELVEESLQNNHPFSLAFLDVRMPPGPNGVWAAEQIRRLDPDIQIVVVTAYSDIDPSAIATRVPPRDKLLYVQKPFHPDEIRSFVNSLCEKWRKERNGETYDRDRNSRDEAVFHLACLAESGDPCIREHLDRVSTYCRILAEELARTSSYAAQISPQFISDIFRSSKLHDIGKLDLPDGIFAQDASLSEQELALKKQHPLKGAHYVERMIQKNGEDSFLRMGRDITRCHHETFNGKGYPLGLHEKEIPLAARIFALADAFDELTAETDAGAPIRPTQAKDRIERAAGTQFDPVVVEAFSRAFVEFAKIATHQHD